MAAIEPFFVDHFEGASVRYTNSVHSDDGTLVDDNEGEGEWNSGWEGNMEGEVDNEGEGRCEVEGHTDGEVHSEVDSQDVTWAVLDETDASDVHNDGGVEGDAIDEVADVAITEEGMEGNNDDDQEGGAQTPVAESEHVEQVEVDNHHEVEHETEEDDDEEPEREEGIKSKGKHIESFRYYPKGARQTGDLEYFLERLRQHLYDDLTEKLQRGGVRFGLTVSVNYYTPMHDRESTAWHRSAYKTMLHPVELEQAIDSQFLRIIHVHANYCKDQTGNIIDSINMAVLEATSYFPKPGGHHFDVPEKLENKKAIVNIQTNDGTCFGYSILTSIYRSNRSQQNRAADYRRYWAFNHLDEIEYPVDLRNIPNIEQLLQIRINVYTYDDDICAMAARS